MSAAHEAATRQAINLRFAVNAHQRDILPGGVWTCRSNGLDVWNVFTETLDGDFDLDAPVAKAFVNRIGTGPSQPDWFNDWLLGDSGSGFANEVKSSTIGPGNILGNAAAAAQAGSYARTQQQTGRALSQGAQRIASGAAKTVRINEFMELYNANPGKGRPRIRLRVRGLPMSVVKPVVYPEAVRSNLRTNTHSSRWSQATREEVRRAAVMAAENRWGRSALGWTTGKVGTGVLAFAPSLALDIYKNIRFDMNASGLSRLAGFDAHAFAVDSAKSQTGNLAGVAAGAAAAWGLTAAASSAVPAIAAFGVAMAGWPVLLVAFGAGIVAQAVWSSSGMADRASGALK